MKTLISTLPLVLALAIPGIAQARGNDNVRTTTTVTYQTVQPSAKYSPVIAQKKFVESRHDDRRDARSDHQVRSNRWIAGHRITPADYAKRYRLSAWELRRLPPARANQIYVRHFGDILLVNVHSGRIVKVFSGRFG